MTTKIKFGFLFLGLLILTFANCETEGAPGPAGQDGQDGQDATVYYSEWFGPTEWAGESGDWYFEATAPDLTEEIVESGVILAYVCLAGDLYDATTVRPLPSYAVDANWSFLIHTYGSIEFTCDMVDNPYNINDKFRFVAIPGTVTALKSTTGANYTKEELRNMSYGQVCELFNISE